MKLSHRLETIASFVRKGSKIADIGTDHGYVPIFLIREGIAFSAIAMDVRTGPLERARSHIAEYGLEDKIQVRISDGLSRLEPGQADTVIIAGMGGELILHILEEGKHMWGTVKHWILSPQSDLLKVRRYLQENGFRISREEMLLEDIKYYVVMDVEPGTMNYTREIDFKYGWQLLTKKDPVLNCFLQKEKKQLEAILQTVTGNYTETSKARVKELKKELKLTEEAIYEMQ